MTTKFASLLTLGSISAMVFTIFMSVAYFTGIADISIWTLFLMVIVFNFLSWIISPIISDFVYRFSYKIKFYKQEEFSSVSPEISAYISEVCHSNNIKFPKVGIIEDDNPTAFTYGSLPSNARLVFTKGIFNYLNKGEVEAVIAHEIGHVVHYDFLVMTIANTLIQILYEVYVVLTKTKKKSSGNDDNKNPLAVIGLISYVFYVIGTYLLLFLSRTREYYADEFSANTTKRPNDLSSALIKIAYGMVTLNSDLKSKKLLESTRALGIMDSRSAKGVGAVSEISGKDSGLIGKVLAYDFVSPWAVILELSSTHPLTGKRIQRLDKIAEDLGQEKTYDMRKIINNMVIDRKKLFRGFYLGLFVYFLPKISTFLGLILFVLTGNLGYVFIFLGLGIIFQVLYKFSNGKPVQGTMLDLMTDIYASPIKGRRVLLEGDIIGRGQAGSYFSEDVMLKDENGLVYLDYNSKFGFLGNLFFALGKVSKIIGQRVSVQGWFFRGNYQLVSVGKINTASEVIKSYPRFWGIATGVFVIFLGFYL